MSGIYCHCQGRLCRDPELKTYPSKKDPDKPLYVVRFTLAVRHPFRRSDDDYHTDFLSVEIWNKKQAEYVAKHAAKGKMWWIRGLMTSDKDYNKWYCQADYAGPSSPSERKDYVSTPAEETPSDEPAEKTGEDRKRPF